MCCHTCVAAAVPVSYAACTVMPAIVLVCSPAKNTLSSIDAAISCDDLLVWPARG
jgi:hypothetical protein